MATSRGAKQSVQELRRVLNVTTQRGLAPVGFGLGLCYAMMSLLHVFAPRAPEAAALIWSTAPTAIALMVLGVASYVRPPPLRWVNVLAAFVGVLAIINVNLHHATIPRADNLALFSIILAAMGGLVLSLPVLIFLLLLNVVTWATVSAVVAPGVGSIPVAMYGPLGMALALVLYVGHVRTISHIVSRQSALRLAQQGLREIVEKYPDAVFVHKNGVIVFANGVLATVLRYEAAHEIVGRKLDGLLWHEQLEGSRAYLETATQQGAARELPFLRRDKERVILDCSPPRRILFEGRESLLVVGRDVSAQHADIKGRLGSADRIASVGNLAAGIAHQINNPLSYVLGDLREIKEGLAGQRANAEAGEDLLALTEEALEGAQRVRQVVGDLRSFSKPAEGEQSPESLRSIVDAAARLAWNEIRHRARWENNVADDAVVLAEPAKLSQVYLNLLLNAAQSIEEGKAAENLISVSGRLDGDVVVSQVRDTGTGMAPETQQRLFEPFFTTKPVGSGAGLGLFYCRNVITEAGGAMKVTSAKGEGSAVTITLPAAEEADRVEVVSPLEAPAASEYAAAAPEDPRSRRVLVVDDDPAVGRAVRRSLRKHNVTTVTDGTKALDEYGDAPFDVVLCDLMMPDMTGRDVFDALAERFPGSEKRVAFLTGGAFTPSMRSFVEKVENPVMEKPWDDEALNELVETMARG